MELTTTLNSLAASNTVSTGRRRCQRAPPGVHKKRAELLKNISDEVAATNTFDEHN